VTNKFECKAEKIELMEGNDESIVRVSLFRSEMNYGFFTHSTSKFYDCHGEVCVDESGTILRISESFDLSGPWYRRRGG